MACCVFALLKSLVAYVPSNHIVVAWVPFPLDFWVLIITILSVIDTITLYVNIVVKFNI